MLRVRDNVSVAAPAVDQLWLGFVGRSSRLCLLAVLISLLPGASLEAQPHRAVNPVQPFNLNAEIWIVKNPDTYPGYTIWGRVHHYLIPGTVVETSIVTVGGLVVIHYSSALSTYGSTLLAGR